MPRIFCKIIIAPAVARVFIALLYKSDVMRMPIAPVATVIATIIPRFSRRPFSV